MADDSADTPPVSKSTGPQRAWLLLVGLPVGLAGALVPLAGLTGLAAPLWTAVIAALAVFPVLPVLWHLSAERTRRLAVPGVGRPLERFALRALAIGLLVLAIAFVTLGPKNLESGIGRLAGRGKSEPAAKPQQAPAMPTKPVAAPQPVPTHDLEPFIPADARWVIALSNREAIKRLFGVHGTDVKKKLAAFEKCHILLDGALVLIAGRDRKTRMIVVRAPGVTDQRNLYCVVGVMGGDKVSLRFEGDKGPVRFEVDGLLPRTFKFEVVDAQTVVAADPAWKETLGEKLFPVDPAGPMPPLVAVIERVNRRAGLWSAGVAETDQGAWDLALDARFEPGGVDLRASSTPPSGAAHRADLVMRLPSEFASSLPTASLDDGIRNLFAVISAAGSGSRTSPKDRTSAGPSKKASGADRPDVPGASDP